MNKKQWQKIRVGDKIKLQGQKVEVTGVSHFTEENELGGYIFLNMLEKNGPFYLVAKIVDNDIEARIYNDIKWLPKGTRASLLDGGNEKLFQEPKSENWTPADLEWAESLEVEINGRPVGFNKKYTVYGELEYIPKPSGLDSSFSSIVEYECVEEVENPEILVLEIGGIGQDGNPVPQGGLVSVLEGWVIPNEDVDKVGLLW